MECTTNTFEIYGKYNAKLGVLDAHGNVWSGDIAIFRIVGDHLNASSIWAEWRV
nr:hypothetical protein [Pseudomonas syringae]